MAPRRTPLKPTSKEAWAASNDAGPHLAVLPSRKVVRFRIPDSSALLRSDRLPAELREVALAVAAHPEGPEGYFEDLARMSVYTNDGRERISRDIALGMEMRQRLVAEMVVEPSVTYEEVAEGLFGEFDILMLIEFAERRRNTDAAGNVLPIITVGEWARFRHFDGGTGSSDPSGENGNVDPSAVPEPDVGVV